MSNSDITIYKGAEQVNIQDDDASSDSSLEMEQMEIEGELTPTRRNDPDLRRLQKIDIYVQQLPYFDQIKKNAFETFELIRKNLASSVALNEYRPGFSHWSNQLIVFIHEYGLFFTKQDHLKLVKLYLGVMTNDNVDLPTVDYCFTVLTELLKKFDKISRDELTIDWKPLYKLYLRINNLDDYSPELAPSGIVSNGFTNFIRYARIYFSQESTREMLEEWRVFMCPFDSAMNTAFERLKLFIPTQMFEHESEYGYKLWLSEFLNLWTTFSTRNFWENHLVCLFSRVAGHNIGEIDWSVYVPYIFSNTLRGFGLPFGSKDSITLGLSSTSSAVNSSLSQIFVYGNDEISTIASWIVSIIGTGTDRDLCMQHIKKLFLALRSFYYPSNSGSWSANLFLFLRALPENLIKRIKRERNESKKWYTKSKQCHITEMDIENFVLALRDVCFTAIFSKSNQSDARKAFQLLTFLRSDLMLEPFLEKVYLSFDSLTEPFRYTSILNCLVVVSRELASFNPRFQTQTHLITLLNQVLPGLDPNDSNKCYLTLQFISNVLNTVIVCDCSPAVNYRSDLTEHEVTLCYETAKFEDFVHEFFKRIFYITDLLASDVSSESSASAAAASKQFAYNSRNKSSDENYYQAHMIHTIKILIRQSSRPILKLIYNKISNYINTNNFNARSGRILSSICGYLASTVNYGKFAFEHFFNQIYEKLSNFKEGRNYQQFMKDERGDLEVEWNLQLLTELTRANGLTIIDYMPKIKNLISWYRKAVNKEITSYLSAILRNVVVSLSAIYPIEQSSVEYDFVYEEKDEAEFFSQHLPIRDWARNGDLFNLGVKYHIPNVTELEQCLDFMNENLTESFNFLTSTINDLSLTSKEERNRELNYVNHLIYAGSRLIKRPVQYSHVIEHVGSQVQIGQLDQVNKGLGFDYEYVNDEAHEYSKLSPSHKELMLTLREKCVRNLIQLGETLMANNSNETLLLQFIARILSTASITYGFFVSDFEKLWKNHHNNKSALQNKLHGKQNSLRSELITRIMLQYQYRTFYIHTRVNQLDLEIINLLFRMSTDSLYATVRKDSQSQLFSLLSHFSYSNLIIVPKLIEMLKRCHVTDDTKLTHDQLKGCLYLLSGNNYQDSLMIKQNWLVLSQLWPVLLRCQNYDKPSIQTQLDKIYTRLDKDFDSFENRVRLEDKVVQLAFDLSSETKAKYDNPQRLDVFFKNSQTDSQMIAELMSNLINIAKESTLSWKNQSTSFGSILYLLHSCQIENKLLTSECVELFVDSLVHENIHVRKIAVDALGIILKMVKHKKEQVEFKIEDLIRDQTNNEITSPKVNVYSPGYRADNKWHLSDPNFLSKNWSNTKFLDKSYLGYYCWPSTIKINSNERKCFSFDLNDTSPFSLALKPLVKRFKHDTDFFTNFMKIFKIEENKGHEKFDKKMFYLFKSLFRNFGSCDIIPDLFSNLKDLITDKHQATQERSHKLAAELISALIRGSKYWSYDKLTHLWSQLEQIFNLLIDNVTTENLSLYKSCFSNAYEDQDPRRLTFYMNYFKNLAFKILPKSESDLSDLNMSSTSFQQTSCLQFLIAFSQLEWRAPEFWSSLVDLLLVNMSHPYKSVREKVGYALALTQVTDIDYSVSINNGFKKYTEDFQMESMKRFINHLELKLNQGIELFDSVPVEDETQEQKLNDNKSPQHLAVVNFLHTIFSWFGYYIYKSYQPVNLEIIRLIPQLCSVDKIAAQEATVKAQLPMIRIAISMWIMHQDSSSVFIEQLDKVIKMKSWMSRLAGLQMLQNFGIFNLFLVDSETRGFIKNLIIESLTDEQLEVRVSASLAMTGLIHSDFIKVDKDLIDKLKSLSATKAKKKDKTTGQFVTNMTNLIKRHGGILGLCSIVNSCPYDVPPYLPDVVTYLCNFINDQVPIQGSVKKCLSEFKRTHHDNWSEHKLQFDENQLCAIMDILISPSYYA